MSGLEDGLSDLHSSIILVIFDGTLMFESFCSFNTFYMTSVGSSPSNGTSLENISQINVPKANVSTVRS